MSVRNPTDDVLNLIGLALDFFEPGSEWEAFSKEEAQTWVEQTKKRRKSRRKKGGDK